MLVVLWLMQTNRSLLFDSMPSSLRKIKSWHVNRHWHNVIWLQYCCAILDMLCRIWEHANDTTGYLGRFFSIELFV